VISKGSRYICAQRLLLGPKVASVGLSERREQLFWLFWLLTLPQPDTRAATILVDEFDAGLFESLPDDGQRRAARFGSTRLYLSNGYNADAGMICEILLTPIKEASRCPALLGGDHLHTMFG
jgi:hypothetical protein